MRSSQFIMLASIVSCLCVDAVRADRVYSVSFSSGQVTATGRVVSLEFAAGTAIANNHGIQIGFLAAVGLPPPLPRVGDINGDGVVGVPDLLLVINGWGNCPPPCPADVAPPPSGDGLVGVPDLLMVINHWG